MKNANIKSSGIRVLNSDRCLFGNRFYRAQYAQLSKIDHIKLYINLAK